MSEHVNLLRLIGELGNPRSLEKEVAEAAADHLEAVEAALRDSTELLQCFVVPHGLGIHRTILNQIAANEAALGENHDSD